MKLKDFLKLQLFAGDGGDGGEDTETESEETEIESEESEDEEEDDPEEKKYSDKEVNKIINRKFAEWEKKRQKEEDEAKKLSKMNQQEKTAYENEKLQKQIDDLLNEKALSEMKDEARKMLSDKGINIPDKLLAFMVSADAETTKEAVDSFTELFNNAVKEAVKGKARQETPKEGGRSIGKDTVGLDIRAMAKEARIIKN